MKRNARVWLLVALVLLGARAQAEGGNTGGGGWTPHAAPPPPPSTPAGTPG